ncbi:MAG: hypothetical protein DI635_00765 [Pseudoxanthomonas suwonensis]|nr:MAG: hypothetical protein DI635_00765 [Pseudoxanthomonas suwonensis]
MPVQRPHDQADGSHRIVDAVDSTAAKLASRFVLPVLLTVIGFFLVTLLGDIRGSLAEQEQKYETLDKSVNGMATTLQVLNTRLDAQVIRQVDSNTARLSEHEKRIQTLERSVKTP